MRMITRFSMYGFLKNMQFFEPFLILYFLSLGLSFLEIGLLVSFRTICVNLMEIPSGAVADIYGRKNAMVFSLSSYIVSFIIFSFSAYFPFLLLAVFFFSIGEAFRTGTHKAMIFDWLRQNNRLNEKTKVYGYTRSWSKRGSALSVLISAAIVILSQGYRWIFLLSVIPYVAGIWNILNYPSYLNRRQAEKGSIAGIYKHLLSSFGSAFGKKAIRRLIVKGTGFEGVFRVSSDYLQPVLKSQAVLLVPLLALPEKDSIAIVVGAVYFVLYMISASASQNSHRFSERAGGEERAGVVLVLISSAAVLAASAGFYSGVYPIAIGGFVILFILQNIWRPILVAQYDDVASAEEQATVLSIESQTKSVGIFFLAPAAGYLADLYGIHASLASMGGLLLILFIYSFLVCKK